MLTRKTFQTFWTVIGHTNFVNEDNIRYVWLPMSYHTSASQTGLRYLFPFFQYLLMNDLPHSFENSYFFLPQVFENLIVAWQDNSLAPEDLGLHDLDPNHILAREDLIAGKLTSSI